MSSKRKEVYWSVDSSPAVNLDALVKDSTNPTKPPSVGTNIQPSARVKKKTSRRSTLKTLCAEDKHRVRLLIEDLAKTGAEKDAIELLLKKERSEFDEKLSHLHLEQQSLQEERRRLERSLQESELKLKAIRSQHSKVGQDIPVFRSAPVASYLQWSHDYPASPTKFISMDHGLNYPLGDDVITRRSSSSTMSSLSSITSPLHFSDITTTAAANVTAHPPTSNALSQPRPPSSGKASPLTNSQPHPHLAYSSSYTDTATQTVVHTGVQTEHYHTDTQTEHYRTDIQTEHYHPATVIPAQPSQQTITSLAASSQEYSKMEQLMATALLNAKDTINTIETLSQSLLLRNVSREASLATIPPGGYTQHVTYSQDVTNKPAVGVTTIQDVSNNSAVINAQSVTYSQDVANKPVVTISQDQATNSQHSSHSTVMTPPTSSHANHMATPLQHNYTLYNDVTHLSENDSYRDDELQLEDLAATLNSTMVPSSWHHSNYFEDVSYIMPTTPHKAKHSNVTMATQPIGKHLLIGQTDSEILKDLFFIK